MRIVGHYPFLFSKMSLLIALENINISCVEQHAIESNTTYEFTNTG